VKATAPRSGALARPTPELLRLAWPAVLSYLLTNSYRINDQFWIKGLGPSAQAAIAASFFVGVMSYAILFLAAGGALTLTAQATGAADPRARDSCARHALLLAIALGAVLGVLGHFGVGPVVDLLELRGEARAHAIDFLGTLFLWCIPLALAPTLDFLFLGRGNSLVPMSLQLLAFALNWFLNPLLIYGQHAGESIAAPGSGFATAIGRALDFDGLGMSGAAHATGISRALSALLGIALLRGAFGLSLLGSRRPKLASALAILKLSAPVSLAMVVYSAVYWALFGLVLSRLGDSVSAGLGIGFQVFEGLSYPLYLGLSLAAAALIGRALGAGDAVGALAVVRAARRLALVLGGTAALAFLGGASFVLPHFASDAQVLAQARLYVYVIACSQIFVALEAVNEKVLLGAGHTRSILVIASLSNALRLPLAWAFAIHWGGGAAAVYWTLNATSLLKATLFWRMVERRHWLERPRSGPPGVLPAVLPGAARPADVNPTTRARP
jgi:putative MATE family efflux protein